MYSSPSGRECWTARRSVERSRIISVFIARRVAESHVSISACQPPETSRRRDTKPPTDAERVAENRARSVDEVGVPRICNRGAPTAFDLIGGAVANDVIMRPAGIADLRRSRAERQRRPPRERQRRLTSIPTSMVRVTGSPGRQRHNDRSSIRIRRGRPVPCKLITEAAVARIAGEIVEA